jgi:hypothetical protein
VKSLPPAIEANDIGLHVQVKEAMHQLRPAIASAVPWSIPDDKNTRTTVSGLMNWKGSLSAALDVGRAFGLVRENMDQFCGDYSLPRIIEGVLQIAHASQSPTLKTVSGAKELRQTLMI